MANGNHLTLEQIAKNAQTFFATTKQRGKYSVELKENKVIVTLNGELYGHIELSAPAKAPDYMKQDTSPIIAAYSARIGGIFKDRKAMIDREDILGQAARYSSPTDSRVGEE